MPKSTIDDSSSSIERNRSAGSTLRIRDPSNTYKCYDSIPTPSPITPSLTNIESNNNCNNNNRPNSQSKNHRNECKSSASQNSLQRAASLDSLVNSSEQETSEEDDPERLSDSDSILELAQITGTNNIEHPRQSDLALLKNIDPQNETVIKAYLEKSHKKCDYKNCGFKRPDELEQEEPIKASPIKIIGSNGNGTVSSVKSNRRNSIASSSSVPKMETILEEPIEAKVSVKEILARFETLREAAEVNEISTIQSLLITLTYIHIFTATNCWLYNCIHIKISCS